LAGDFAFSEREFPVALNAMVVADLGHGPVFCVSCLWVVCLQLKVSIVTSMNECM